MCPGGYVLSSGTNHDGIVVNGMSNFARNSPWSNAALVVTVKAGRDFDSTNLLSGLAFQRDVEKRAHELSIKKATGREIPAQTIEQFLAGKKSNISQQKHSCPSGIFSQEMNGLLPGFITAELKTALGDFDKKIKGFSSEKGLLLAPETRTSAPVNIVRDKRLFNRQVTKDFILVVRELAMREELPRRPLMELMSQKVFFKTNKRGARPAR